MPQDRLRMTIPEPLFRTALKHALEIRYADTSPNGNWRTKNKDRAITKAVFDRLEGKLGEVGVTNCVFKRMFGIKTDVEWAVFDSVSETDDADFYIIDNGEPRIPSKTPDVKKTKPQNLWLLIRKTIWNDHAPEDPFILTTIDLDEDDRLDLSPWENNTEKHDGGSRALSAGKNVNRDYRYPADDPEFQTRVSEWWAEHGPLEVTVVGWAKQKELIHEYEEDSKLDHPTQDRKLGPSDGLETDNRGLPKEELRSSFDEWENLVQLLTEDLDVTPAPKQLS